MKTIFFAVYLVLTAHWARTEPIDEATVRSIIIGVALTLVYLAIRAIARIFKL